MLSKFKHLKHHQHLAQLPKLPIEVTAINTLYSTKDFKTTLLNLIRQATSRIYIVALYFEHDEAGQNILEALYQAKQHKPELEICIFVDWHRAQRGRIGAEKTNTNANWYHSMTQRYIGVDIPILGVPVNTREALGVLHLKGFIIDNTILYSGASINDVYLHQFDKYRYDRYHLITNPALTDTMVEYIQQHLLKANAVQRLDRTYRPNGPEFKNEIRQFRLALRKANYHFIGYANNDELAVTPLVGLGKRSLLNKTIYHLMLCTEQKLTLCTPYFNLPTPLIRSVTALLRQGKQIEIIIGDKTANDFYIPEDQPFKIIGALPYLYEINLRRFARQLQRFLESGQLIIRLWKDKDNSYHLKGIWVDNEWQLLTGNNLNPRAWLLDLENAILIHDPKHELQTQRYQELSYIQEHTKIITHYQELQNIRDYPVKVRKLIRRLRRIRIDRLINRLL